MFFGQDQQSQPAMLQGGPGGMPQLPPELMQMLMQRMQQGGGAAQTPQTPVNIPQTGMMPDQSSLMGTGQPHAMMNPLASILGNQGGAMGQQGGLNNGSAMGGIMQIINAMKAARQVNGTMPQQGTAGNGIDLASIISGMGGMSGRAIP